MDVGGRIARWSLPKGHAGRGLWLELEFPGSPGPSPGRRGTSSEGPASSRPIAPADTGPVARLETPTHSLRDRALVLSAELGIDPAAWYLRVLESSRAYGGEPDLGALVRAYWELQRVSGRTDLRTEWRRLADLLWAA